MYRCAPTPPASATKSIVPRYREDLAEGQIEAGRASMIMMDDPEHSRLRKIVSRAFTPRGSSAARRLGGACLVESPPKPPLGGFGRLRPSSGVRIATAGDRRPAGGAASGLRQVVGPDQAT